MIEDQILPESLKFLIASHSASIPYRSKAEILNENVKFFSGP
jgi:hypothetical protein